MQTDDARPNIGARVPHSTISTRIMAMVMAAAMTVSAAPAVYAAERADSETIKEDNQPAAEDSTESADTEDSSTEATKTEYPLTITTGSYRRS